MGKSVHPTLTRLDNQKTLVLTGKVGTQQYFCVFCVQSYKWFEKVTIQNRIHCSPTEGRPTNLAKSRISSWSGVFCVAGKDVNFYTKKSNQVTASGRFRLDHARKNIPFVWH